MRRAGRQATVVLLGLAVAVIVVEIGACGRPPAAGGAASDEANATDENGEPIDFAFPEDADPAMAGLPFAEDKLLSRTLPGADPDDIAAAYAETGVAVLKTLPEIQTTVLRVEPDELVAAAAKLSANPLFEAVQKDYLYEAQRTPNDTKFGSQGYLERIGLPDAWDITTGAADVMIAVLDTGVAADHSDLTSKLLDGWNTFDGNNDTRDDAGHGTSVAGVAGAASDNGLGIAGVAWDSPIVPVRVTNARGRASSGAIATGLVWAVNHGARVMNVSFAPLQSDRTVLRAARHVRSAGGLVFISTGNDGRRSTADDNANAVFVGATDASDRVALFSSYGPFVDLVAPGTGINTTALDGGYRAVAGTSFASPIAAGVAALIWSVRPELRPATVEALLKETAIDLGPSGQDDSSGAGLVDAAAAVAEARSLVEQDDETPPLADINNPKDGKRVSGVVRVVVWAADSTSGVADVVLSIDGRPFATDTAEPYQFALNTRRLARGTHTLSCVATDEAGNSSTPVTIRIVIGEGSQGTGGSGTDTIDPDVIINFPIDGTRVSTSVAVQATATDNAALAQAKWLVDGGAQRTTSITNTRAVVNFVWDADGYGQGTHTITVLVTDTAGNEASASVSVVKQ